MSTGASFLRRCLNPSSFLAAFERARPNRADRALFGGKQINFGNSVTFSHHKTRRNWKPNVQTKRLWSDCFDTMLRLRVTTHVLKCIDKVGGLDNYLASTSNKKIDSKLGSYLKEQVIEQRRRLEAGEEPLPPPRMATPLVRNMNTKK